MPFEVTEYCVSGRNRRGDERFLQLAYVHAQREGSESRRRVHKRLRHQEAGESATELSPTGGGEADSRSAGGVRQVCVQLHEGPRPVVHGGAHRREAHHRVLPPL